jgi:predicted nucleic acid-binding protein
MPVEQRLYWDSSAFISRIQRTPGRIEVLEHITGRAEKGEVEIVTSAFTLCEVAKGDENALPEDQEKTIVDFFENPYILVQQVDVFVAARTRGIVRRFGLKPADAVHVASALAANAAVLQTYDSKHLLPLDRQVEGLRVEQPSWGNAQPPLGLDD